MNGKMRRAGLTAAAALTMSLALAPGFAMADSGHHGHGQNEHGQQHQSQSDHRYKSHKEHDRGDRGEKFGFQLRVQATLAALNKAAAYYNPLIQTAEQKVQTELASAIQASATVGAQSPANTSADVAIEQQIQAAITQMSSVQSPQQLLSLVSQVSELVSELKAQVKQSSGQHRDDHGKGDDHSHAAYGWMNAILHAFGLGEVENSSSGGDVKSLQQMQAKLQTAEGRYAALYARVQAVIQSDSSGSVTPRSAHLLWSLLHSYDEASAELLHGLTNIGAYLSTLTTVTTPPSGGTGTTVASATYSTMSVSQGTITAGQNVTVSGSVYSTADAAMSGVPVTVTVDGVSAQTQSAANGGFSVTLQPTTAADSAPISVVAGGTAVNGSQFDLTVNPGAPYSITSSATSAAGVGASQMSAITYTVKDQYGNVVPNAMVDFSVRQAVGTSTEAQAESAEAAGTLSMTQLPTGANGQVTVDYTSSSTADNDGDVVDAVVATVAGTSVTNAQAQFTY